MGQGGDATLGRRVALGLGLAHPVPGRGDIYDGPAGCKVGRKQLGKIKGGGNAHPQGVVELLVAARVNALHQGQGIIDQKVHMTIVGNHLAGKILQNGLVGQITHKIIVGK